MHLTQKKIVRYFYSLALFIQSFSNLDKHVKGALSLKICTTTSIENLKPMQVVKLFCMLPGACCLAWQWSIMNLRVQNLDWSPTLETA
jgi:hypothetical protein